MATLSSPTLDRLIKETRVYLNQKKNTNTTWADEDLALWINDGIRTFFLEIDANAEGQFDKQTTINITANVDTVPLPTDFFKVKKVTFNDGQNFIIIPYNNDITSSYDSVAQGSSTNYTPYYFFRGNNLVIRPIPAFSGTFTLEYTAFPDTLIWGGDVLTSSISPVFKELVVLHAVYKAKIQQDLVNGGNTSAKAASLLSDAYHRFKETVGSRSKYPTFIIPFNP